MRKRLPKRIRNGEFRLSAKRFNEEHEVCRNFIEKAVSESNAERIVVATHLNTIFRTGG